MAELEYEEMYKIDKSRLLKYYNRIQRNNSQDIENVAKFLLNQSIGHSIEEITDILLYYQEKLDNSNILLDFALEWIRAQKIRLEYKKYIVRAPYGNDLTLAVDDCISSFFLEYNDYIRKLLKLEIKEYEISALLEIFFSTYDTHNSKLFDLEHILLKHKVRVPTYFKEGDRVDTSIITIRSGLSEIIIKDYESVLFSRKEQAIQEVKKYKVNREIKKGVPLEFGGSQIQRRIKAFCINKKEIRKEELESAVNEFISPYFKFGKFYEFEKFESDLVRNFTESMYSGLSPAGKEKIHIDELLNFVGTEVKRFQFDHRIKILDGSAWKQDLTAPLSKILQKIMNRFFHHNGITISLEQTQADKDKHHFIDGEGEDGVDFAKLFDLNLEIEEYRERVENDLKDSNLGLIQKRNLIRKKVQEFTSKKRRGF